MSLVERGSIPPGTEDQVGSYPPKGWLLRLAWLPLPLLLAAIIAARAAGLRESYEFHTLLLVLSVIFYTLVSLGTIFLVGRSFLAVGSQGLLFLECGVILWSLAGTLGDAVSHGDANINVTIFNTSILLAGICHLVGAVLVMRPQRTLRAKRLWLATACVFSLGALWLITRAALSNWLPVFFIPGHGGTPVRYCVLIATIAMIVLSACLLCTGRRAARPAFTSWYAIALLLLAVGLFGVMIQLSLGSVVNWLGRAAQWLGGVYLLIAAVAALRESHLQLLPLGQKARTTYYRDAMAVVLVLAAAALRLVFLSAMGTHSPYVLFYPAVTLAAIYGGWGSGFLATAVAALLAAYLWIPSIRHFAFIEPADYLGLVLFLLGAAMIVLVIEALHRARARVSAAETQALLAAERAAAMEELRKSEERYRGLFGSMAEAFALHEIITNEQGQPCDYRFLDVNDSFERMTGLKRSNVINRNVRDVLPGIEDSWIETYGRVAITGQPVNFEKFYPAPLNRWYEVFAYRPTPHQFAAIFLDVSRRKQAEEDLRKAKEQLELRVRERTAQLTEALEALRQSEQEFRTLAEAVPQMVWTTRPDGWNIYFNQKWVDYTGMTLEESYGHGWNTPFHPDDRQRAREAWTHATRDEAPYSLECRLRRSDGVYRWWLIRGEPMRDANREILKWFGTCTDIEELKQASEQLRRITSELMVTEQRERQRLAQILHDGLQQILVGAKYRLALLDRGGNIQQTADQVGELIDDAIETSRSLSAELSPPILLKGDFVSALEWLARWMQDKHGMEVNLTARTKIARLKEDAILLLFQAARELLFNVVKHAGVKHACVEVNQLDGHVSMTVEDKGVGFDKNKLALRGGQSSGIGLFGISERLFYIGGKIEIESAPGQGSRFRLIVPMPEENTEADQGAKAKKARVSVAISAPLDSQPAEVDKKIRIALVDDHIVVRQGLAGLLRCEPDFAIAGEASDGQSAIDLIRDLLPDVVLMDINMPGMDGIQATRIIHGEFPDVRIIGLSMFQEGEQQAAMREAGAVDYLTKSGPSETLIKAVRDCVRVSGKLRSAKDPL